MEFRKLNSNEIDVKVGSVGAKGYTLLLYKNARVDMAILDETVGAENWQNKFYEVCGNLYCSVGINVNALNAKGVDVPERWVWKDDCGVESAFGDKEKGQASDARKRAGFAWGIGRELYTSPFIFIPCETIQDGKSYKIADSNEKFRKFAVKEITFTENGEIDKLVIVDTKGVVAFSNKTTTSMPSTTVTKTEEKKKSQYSGTKCIDCDEDITEKVANYSKDKYGIPLCFNCQKKHDKEITV